MAMMPRGVRERDLVLPSGTFQCLEAAPEGGDDAPLVLCLHGFPDHPRSFGPVMARLVDAGYRVAAPWMRGYHPSVLSGPYNLERIALDIVEMAHELSPERPIFVVGHDWGAGALYLALAEAPAQFTASAALAVPHPLMFLQRMLRSPWQLRRSWYMFFFQLAGVADHAIKRNDFAFIDHLWHTWSPGYVLPIEDRTALHACLRVSMPAPVEYYRALLRPPQRAFSRLRNGPLANQISVPMLYMHGLRDGCIHYTIGRGQSSYFTGPYEHVLIQGAGHFLQLEAPDAVAGHIIDWFQGFPADAR